MSLLAGGTTTVKAKQLGDSTYAAAAEVLQTLTVIDDSLQPQSITWNQDLSSVSFSTTDLNMSASATSGMAITYTSSDESIVKVVNGTFLQMVGGGTAVVSASQTRQPGLASRIHGQERDHCEDQSGYRECFQRSDHPELYQGFG